MAQPKKIINQAAINQANAANAAAAQQKAAYQAAAAAAFEKGKPILTQAISGASKVTAMVNAGMAAIINPSGLYDPISGKVTKTAAQLKQEAATTAAAATGMNKYGGLTPEQIELSKVYGAEKTAAENAAAAITFGNVPSPIYDTASEEAQTRVLAEDTFRNTLALLWGTKEASEPYVGKLYQFVSGFYKSGSTIDEAINLSIRKARDENAIPEFTKRFAGIFALEDKLRAGQAVEVPTIKEFFAAEARMGEVLQSAGLGSLATQEFLGGVIGRGKSVLDVTNLISDVFNTIDYAPAALKETLSTYFPGVDRASIAQAILTGEQGATELSNKIKGISVLSAAGTQGVKGIDLTYAQNIANMGISYQEALTGFGTVKNLERAGTIAEFGRTQFTTEQAQQAVFEKSAQQISILDQIKAQELGRFQGRPGTTKTSFVTGGTGQY
jgi:hypothetical protein